MDYRDLQLDEPKRPLLDFLKEPALTPSQLDFLEERPNLDADDFLFDQKEQASPPQSRITQEEKEAIFEEFQSAGELSFRFIATVLGVAFLCLLIFLPKIYIRNNIYYTSRNIIQLQTQLDSLHEENKHIRRKLEDIKFNNLTQEFDF